MYDFLLRAFKLALAHNSFWIAKFVEYTAYAINLYHTDVTQHASHLNRHYKTPTHAATYSSYLFYLY